MSQLAKAPADGVFPHDFYVTTNQQTFVRLGRQRDRGAAGHDGQRDRGRSQEARGAGGEVFRCQRRRRDCGRPSGHPGCPGAAIDRRAPTFFNSSTRCVDARRTEDRRSFASWRGNCNARAKRTARSLIVGGPAVVRTGAGEHLERLIECGYVDRLFAGNAFAVYDVERALFGTSLGMNPERALCRSAATRITCAPSMPFARAAGSPPAVQKKVLHARHHARLRPAQGRYCPDRLDSRRRADSRA